MVQEPHRFVSWLDHFSLSQSAEPSSALGALCRTPVGDEKVPLASGIIQLLPGVDMLDLCTLSEKTEIWKDGQTWPCLVPQPVVGWEFYSLLWPQPGGTSRMRLSSAIDLMVGRPPRGDACPSLLFAFVPEHHVHASSSSSPSKKGWERRGRTLLEYERQSSNLDINGRTKMGRLVVLCPSIVYKDAAALPDEHNWGLFIGPRSRALVLLNKQRGRIDLHLAMLLAIDAVFRRGRGFVTAISRLFEPFDASGQVCQLLESNFDPLRVHSGLTNAVHADHVSVTLDGREDYWNMFGVRLPAFFLSNASCNLLFSTPSEVHQARSNAGAAKEAPKPGPLPDMPEWTLAGPFSNAEKSLLHGYRERVPVLPLPPESIPGSGFLHLLGFDSSLQGREVWPFSLGGCAEITKGGDSGEAIPAVGSSGADCDADGEGCEAGPAEKAAAVSQTGGSPGDAGTRTREPWGTGWAIEGPGGSGTANRSSKLFAHGLGAPLGTVGAFPPTGRESGVDLATLAGYQGFASGHFKQKMGAIF